MRRPRRPALLRALALSFALTLPIAGCGGGTEPAPVATVETVTFAPSLGVDLAAAGWTRTSTGLYYRTLASPATASATVAAGQTVTVRYTGWLSNGTEFESSTLPNLTIGRGNVIAGWDQGIVGMRVGERRRLLIPPSLGYGARGNNEIPGNAVLVFDVEVLSAG